MGELTKLDVQIYVRAYAYDMTKIVSLSEKAYRALKRLKRDGESFPDIVSRLAGGEEPKSLLLFTGKWVGGDLDEVFARVTEERERSILREWISEWFALIPAFWSLC